MNIPRLKSFIGYFFRYIMHSKTRQRLIFLAVIGLFLSSMSLLVLQGVMQGLQKNMIVRSKSVEGSYLLKVGNLSASERKVLKSKMSEEGVTYHPEYEVELLAKYDAYIAPVILRGVDFSNTPSFLKNYDNSGVILGADLSGNLKAPMLSEIAFFSPSHSDELFGDIPRMSSDTISDIAVTDIAEVDSIVAWTRLSFVQNLTREVKENIFRVYDSSSLTKVRKVLIDLGFQEKVPLLTWEDQNPSLLWAFKLETIVIISLFVCMCFLISLTIVSGNLIFFNKIRFDLVSFWMLGLSKKTITSLMFIYFQIKTIATCLLGLMAGGGVLWWLKNFAPDIMPDVFLERSLPVSVSFNHILVSFAVPYGVSSLFTFYALYYFYKDNSSYIELLRKVRV